METPINAGNFQEYDYTLEDAECEWKQVTEYWRLNGSNQFININGRIILIYNMAKQFRC